MNFPVIPVTFRVHLNHCDTKAKRWVKVFGRAFFAPDTPDVLEPIKPGKNECSTKLTFKYQYERPDEYFFVWVFVESFFCGRTGKLKLDDCKGLAATELIGRGTVTWAECYHGKEGVPLLDINGNLIGDFCAKADKKGKELISIQLNSNQLASVAPMRLSVLSNPLPKLGALIEEQLTRLHKENFAAGSNITKLLPRYIYRPVPTHAGQVPMCLWLALRLRNNVGDCSEYIIHSQKNALFLMNGLMPTKIEQQAEMLAEMQALSARSILYVQDQARTCSKTTTPVDDWQCPHDHPDGTKFCADCEDLALLMMQESILLRLGTPVGRDGGELASLDRGYFTFFCCMTLKLDPEGKQWTYHATVLKLDAEYVLMKLKGRAPDKSKKKTSDFLPAILMEGTAYTTACWEYTPDSEDEIKAVGKSSIFIQDEKSGVNIETMAKATARSVKTKRLYGHIISLVCLELQNDPDLPVLQIELGQGGKHGAAADKVMAYSEDVTWHAIALPPKKLTIMRNALHNLQAAFPRTPIPGAPTDAPELKDPLPPKNVCCRVLHVYWLHHEKAIRAELAKKTGVDPMDIQATVLHINDRGQKLVVLSA